MGPERDGVLPIATKSLVEKEQYGPLYLLTNGSCTCISAPAIWIASHIVRRSHEDGENGDGKIGRICSDGSKKQNIERRAK
jgi:hypothetical protein